MKSFTILTILAGLASAQDPYPTPPSAASVPSAPPLSQPEVSQYISNIPACWIPCVGGAIKYVCPNDDSWECACNAYFNTTTTNPDFIQIATYDPACANANGCSQNVGASDGGEQGEIFFPFPSNMELITIRRIDISGLLVNICIAIPDALTTSIASALAATPTSTSSSTASPKPTKNAAAGSASFLPLELLAVPFVLFGGVALL
jgi:hypothetical protein